MTTTSGVRSDTVRARYAAVAILALVLLLNHTDRLIIGILLEPIRAELGLSDAAMGLLTGPVFSVVYALLVIPIARLSERRSRVRIVTICLVIWSAGTLACGLAGGFVSLFFARMLVAAGEAGGVAPSMSAIADLFPGRGRATALALFGLGASAGAIVTPLLGGMLVSSVGWRATFVTLGLIGAPIALLLALSVREPPRAPASAIAQTATAALARLFHRKSYALLVVASVLVALAQFAMLLWLPAFFQRSFDTASDVLGVRLSVFQGVPMLLGTAVGGFLADRLSQRDPRWLCWMMVLTSLVSAVFAAGLFATPTETAAFAMLVAPSFFQGLSVGPGLALVAGLAAARSRATAMAALTFCVTIVGASLGPLLIGLLSDLLFAGLGEQSLRYAFFAVCPAYGGAAAAFLMMSRFFSRDLADAEKESAEPARSAA